MREGRVDEGVGWATTLNPRFTEWVSEPDVPVIVTLTWAVGAEEAAEKVNSCEGPGVRLKFEGETETPVGRPLICTLIVELKPLELDAMIEAVAEPPVGTEILVELIDKVKS
jgi:hypothetical protein